MVQSGALSRLRERGDQPKGWWERGPHTLAAPSPLTISAWGTPLPPRFRVGPPPPQAGEGHQTARSVSYAPRPATM